MEVPSDRCGFELERELLIDRGKMFEGYQNRILRLSLDQWYEKFKGRCCWREVWNDKSRCIWHAKVDAKPIQDLLDAKYNEPAPMSIDGAYLREIQSSGDFSFRNSQLIGADFSGAYLRETDFSGSILWGSDFSEADLTDAYISEASFKADLSDEDLDIPLTWASSNLSQVSLNGANLSDADLTYVDLSSSFINDADFTNANLEMADLSDANLIWSNLSSSILLDADLSGANLQSVDLRGANMQDTIFSDVLMNRETRIGKPDFMFYYQKEQEKYDSLARAYHRLGEAALKNGLIGEARRLRIWERKARRKEAQASGDWQDLVGALLSEYVMGYGVSVRRVSVAILVTILISAVVYWIVDLPGVGTPIQALDYSLTIFTGIGSTTGPPTTQPARSVAILESFVGILFSVLLGYVLGTRESP